MKILAIAPDNANGVTYHRIMIPAYNLQGHEVVLSDNLDNVPDSILNEFDCVWWSRFYGIGDEVKQVERLRAKGLPYVLDVDDYWVMPSLHLNYKASRRQNAEERHRYIIRNADAVITTTDYLASHVMKLNRRVVVAPNALDLKQPQWQKTGLDLHRMAFGWFGSVHHYQDLELLKGSLNRIHRDNSTNLVLAGHDGGDIFDVYEGWMSNYHKYNHFKSLPSRDVHNYGYLLDEMDVVLIPLVDNHFNRCKSQLKAIEAGIKGKAVIASGVHPYTIMLNNTNSLLVGDRDADFYKAIKKLNDNPILAYELSQALHVDALNYTIDRINPIRQQLFDTIK